MNIPSLDDLLNLEVSDSFDKTPVPEGTYNAVITGCEVRKGAKGPYLSIEVTIHDEDFKGRKVWRNSSFSEKAVGMPGGIANLLQATRPRIAKDTPANALPAAIADAVVASPVTIEVEHEQVKRNGVPATLSDGTPEMRAQVRHFAPATDEFSASIEAEAAGLDDDLPF